MNARTERDIIKVRVHDGIVGLLYIGSIALANEYGFNYIYIALAVAILQILSPITKFCPESRLSCFPRQPFLFVSFSAHVP